MIALLGNPCTRLSGSSSKPATIGARRRGSPSGLRMIGMTADQLKNAATFHFAKQGRTRIELRVRPSEAGTVLRGRSAH
jgi:hypothetical protein